MFAKTTNSLFLDLHDLQRAGVLVNTRLILDDGELSIHWFMLDLYGYQQWWTGWARLEVTMLSFFQGFHWQKQSSLLIFCMGDKTVTVMISNWSPMRFI